MQTIEPTLPQSHANPEVLEFYKTLPFNFRESVAEGAKAVRASNQVLSYPPLPPLLRKGRRVLDVGCGAGWFSNSAALHYPVAVTGIDFNPVAVERAREVAAALRLTSRFEVADLFTYRPAQPFDLAVSLGVLHHTDDCHAALRHVFTHCVAPGGHAFVGLYHHHGRKPFLDHFEQMKQRGATEAEMLARYAELHGRSGDNTHLYLWFRDQVLHPHETQHTLQEVMPLAESCGLRLVATSINGFKPFRSLPALYDEEAGYHELGVKRLAENRYFPGFFVFLLQKST